MVPVPLNDGMNTPVPDRTEKLIPSASEAALIKQAENPLGDPHKVYFRPMEVKRKAPVQDTRSIDTSDDYTVVYWMQELNTTKLKLLAAVAEVGDSFEAVKKQLKKP